MDGFQSPPNVKVFKHLHSSFREQNPNFCRKSLIKDYIGGDLTNPELIPGIEDDPVLQQQCRNYGYMLIQMGDQVRQVYCGTGQAEECGQRVLCPYCQEYFCEDHFAQHMGFDPFTAPEAYIQAPAADPRTEMSTWDNAELNRMLGERRAHEKLLKALQPESSPEGEHAISPEAMLTLPLDQRIQAEVWSYVDEYKSPPSVADISVELETRGKDVAFQEATERYAHANDSWLPEFMEQMASQGLIDRTPEGWYLPPRGWTMKHLAGQHDQADHAGDRQRHESYIHSQDADTASYLFSPKLNDRVKITGGPAGHEGETGTVLYSRKSPGMEETERQYIIGLGQKDRYGNYPNKVMRTADQLEQDLAGPSPTQLDIAVRPPPGIPPGAVNIMDLVGKKPPVPGAPPLRVGGPTPYKVPAPEGWETSHGRVAIMGGLVHGKKDYFLQPPKIDERGPKIDGLSIVNWEPYDKETITFKTGHPGARVRFEHGGKEVAINDGDKIKSVPVTEETIRDWFKDIPPEERAGLRLNVHKTNTPAIARKISKDWVVEGRGDGAKIRLKEPGDDERFDVRAAKVGAGSKDRAGADLGGAFYLGSHKTLFIGKQSEYSPHEASLKRILTHETGHHVQDSILSPDDSADWNRHWENNRDSFRENLGEYSATESYEGFAEFYEKSKSNPGLLRDKMPDSWAIFEKMLANIKRGSK